MGWKNLDDMRRAHGRFASRYGRIGREREAAIAKILLGLQQRKKIDGFIAHEPHSPEDGAGKDFTMWREDGPVRIERSFGVTISHESYDRARLRYPEVPQFWFPLETKPETIEKRLLTLFN